MAKLKTWQERLRDNDFPEPAPWKSPEECQAAYESGFPGAYLDEENWASIPPADSILDGFGADASSGEGELVLLYPELYKASGKSEWWEGQPSQQVGDCVSHATRNALMLSLACQITRGKGSESWPDNIPEHAYKSMSCFTPVVLYNTRSNAPGHGWSCPTSVKNAESIVALVPACDYTNTPGVNRDYSKYSGKQTTEFGKKGPPKEYFEALNGHKCEGSAKANGKSDLMKFMKQGFALSTCGSEGWSSSRDQYGEAKRKGSWSHALVYCGYDDTKWAHDHFGETAILIANSWGPGACKGGRDIHGDPSMGQIPKNAWWTPYSKCKSRHCTAITAVKGWPPAKLPDWNERMSGLI